MLCSPHQWLYGKRGNSQYKHALTIDSTISKVHLYPGLNRWMIIDHEWPKKWQMPFNLDKCKIMHIGHKNKNEKYELLGKEIESVQQEKDLGVVITNDLKSSNQCIEAVKKAQKLLGYIKRQFRTRNKETILTLYNALVRPHLEYAVQFW